MKSLLGAVLLALALSVLVTWPQAINMGSAIVSHHNPYFSIWRLAWTAHALPTSPGHLFDANIFYPATDTLAFSDATLLEGILGAPLFWARVPPVLIYNVLLMVGFVGSGAAMFVLARHLTGATGPALVAAAVFTAAPYRIEHVMHLELQWAMWIPLTFWALHRALDEQSWRFGLLAGLFAWLQLISCVYYGVFLAVILAAFVPVLLMCTGRRSIRALPAILAGGVLAGVLALPYLWPYLQAAQTLGARDATEIARYSARPVNYLATTSLNLLWGWTADRWGSPELRLFPGLMAVAVALCSVAHRSWRWTMLYAIVALVAVELSFGTNGFAYRALSAQMPSFQGFRSASRFAIVASAGLAVLSALGSQALLERVPHDGAWRLSVVPAILILIALEGANRAMPLTPEQLGTVSPIYRVIRSVGPGVMISELPLSTPASLPGWDAYYAAWSITHWNPLVNGYSGYYPEDYLQTLMRMQTFPDDASIDRLRAHEVRYVVIHQAWLPPDQYTRLMLRMAVRPEFKPYGTYRDPVGNAQLFLLER